MLIALLISALACAGELVIHAEVPVEVAVDGHTLAQIFRTGRVHLPVQNGERRVALIIGGKPTMLRLEVSEGTATHIVVGRTGVTTRVEVDESPPEGPALVEVRAVGRESLRLRLGEQRYQLAPGDQQLFELLPGRYPAELRSGSGLAIFATGILDVRGGGPIVVQLSEGRAPEVVGSGGTWRPADR